MTINKAIEAASAAMKLSAQAFADKGRTAYSAEMHASCAGLAMARVIFEAGAEQPIENEKGERMKAPQVCAALFHALYNHSAWRQKWEKAGIFAAATKRVSNLEGLLGELEEEGV